MYTCEREAIMKPSMATSHCNDEKRRKPVPVILIISIASSIIHSYRAGCVLKRELGRRRGKGAPVMKADIPWIRGFSYAVFARVTLHIQDCVRSLCIGGLGLP